MKNAYASPQVCAPRVVARSTRLVTTNGTQGAQKKISLLSLFWHWTVSFYANVVPCKM